MTQRYFVEQPIAGTQATLLAAEAHHLAHVMRGKPGQQVTLFDGRGGEYLAEVTRVDRAAVQLCVLSHHAIERELPIPVTMAVSLPKGDRQRWLIEKLVELGVSTFVPLITTRGVAQPTGSTLERLERAVIEAAKQCGRNRLMAISTPREFREFVSQAPVDSKRIFAHPGAPLSISQFGRETGNGSVAGFSLIVGPEGGLTDDETTMANAAGWTAVDLGTRILRVETAAAMLATTAALIAAN
ncbi:MAG TPA: 16S rRNA (uracil(1498)-N(3))-methyltransferase [Pirellulales bacterium]|jgi:16S rRNA (uracil1498-N3)-methyltransferase